MSEPIRLALGKSSAPGKKRRTTFLAGFMFATLLVSCCFLLVNRAMGPLSTPRFCVKCHEMQDVYDSWELSPHHTNSSAISVDCVSCHLPPRENVVSHLTAKARAGARDAFVHLFFKYDSEAARERALESLPSERCLHCHSNLSGQPSSGAVGVVHASAVENPESEHHGCVACHDRLHGPVAEAEAATEYELADNSFCYVCHVNFETEEFVVAHRSAEVGCVDCHGDCDDHQDDEDHLAPPDIMYPKAKVNASCAAEGCHPQEELALEIGHGPFLANATSQQEYCTDCHGAHRLITRQRRWDKVGRNLIEKDGHPVAVDGDSVVADGDIASR